MFDHEVRIYQKGIVHHLEINIDRQCVYEGDFPHYTDAATFAEQFLVEEYHKKG
jgi:hypothetical protein